MLSASYSFICLAALLAPQPPTAAGARLKRPERIIAAPAAAVKAAAQKPPEAKGDEREPAPPSPPSAALQEAARQAETASSSWEVRSLISDGTHEEMTYNSLRLAGIPGMPTSGNECPPAGFSEVLRGVLFNDDPAGWLFNDPGDEGLFVTPNLCGAPYWRSTGAMFGTEFKVLGCTGENIPWPRVLMCATHVGVLQFQHGMATDPSETPQRTRADMLDYLHFAYDVATGRILDSRRLIDALPESLRGAFATAGVRPEITVRHYFAMTDQGRPVRADWLNIPLRALGSILHVIQDSYAMGHIGRVAGTGEVLQFRDYGEQDESLHNAYDKRPVTAADIKRRGFDQSVAMGGKLAAFWRRNASWDAGVEQLFADEVFPLSKRVMPAGSGQVRYTLTFQTASCGMFGGCGTFNDALVSFCYEDGRCTQEYPTCGHLCRGYWRGTTELRTVSAADAGCLKSVTLRKPGSDDWNLERFSVRVEGQICGAQSMDFRVGWIRDERARTLTP